jgi:hypothetical protein
MMCFSKAVALIALTILTLTVKAQSIGALLAPSPFTVALTIGQWLIKDSKKVYFVQVESTAASPAEARAEGFKLAVSQAVGTLVVAESEVKNQQLVRSEIVQYSSGYIQDFKILSETQIGSMTRIVMNVWVTESKIADRLLSVSKADGVIEGERSAALFQNNLSQQQSGDNLLRLVLRDFPSKAFDLQVGKSIVAMQNRDVQIQIPVKISWNKEYISALAEALDKTRDGQGFNSHKDRPWAAVIRYKNKSDWFMSTASFRDRYKPGLLDENLIQSHPLIRLVIKNDSGAVQFDECYRYSGFMATQYQDGQNIRKPIADSEKKAGRFYFRGGESPHNHDFPPDLSIFGNFSDEINFNLNVTSNLAKGFLEQSNKVEVTVIRGKQCN